MSILNPLRFYLINFPDDTVFTADVASTPSDPYIDIAYSSGVTGSFGAPLAGQTVYLGTSSDQKLRGTARLRTWSGGAAGTIRVGENDDTTPNVIAGDKIRIISEFRLWPKYPRFLQQGEIVTIFNDYDEAFTNQTNTWRPKAVAGPPGFALIEGGQAQISFVGDRSQAMAPGATISSYLWTARDSTEGTSTSQGTEASPVVFTWTSPGRHLVTLQVTDSNGNTDTQHTWAIAENPDNLQVSFTDFDVTSDSYDFNQGGGEISFTVPKVDGGVDVFPEESMVMLVAVGNITTPTGSWPFRTNVLFNGWILANSVRQNPNTSDISFRAATVDAIMKNLTMFPVSLTDVATAVDWTQAKSLTVDRAAYFLYIYRSTLGLMTPVVFSGYSQLIRRQDFGPTDLYSQVQNELMRSIHGAGKVVCSHQGVLYHEVNYNVQLASERASVTTRKLLHKGIWVNDVGIEENHDYAQPTRQVKMSGINYPGGQIEDICPVFSEAPGDAPKVYGNETNFDRLIVVSQSDLNARSGLWLAKLTERYPIYRQQFLNDGSFTITPQEVFPANIESTDNNRELSYTGNLIPRRISRQLNHQGGYFTVSVDFEPDTTGPAGVAVDMPCGPPDQVLPQDNPDPPASLPGQTALVAGTTGTSFYYAPGTEQTWQRRVNGLADPSQLGFLDVLPDPWSTFKQGYNPDNVIVWGSGRGFLMRSKNSGQDWTSRGEFITPQGWPSETAPDLSEVDVAKIDISIFAEDELYTMLRWQETGAYHGAIAKTVDGFAYDWFNLTGSAQVRPLGMSLDRGNGQCLYVTTWEDEPTGTIYLRQYSTSDMSLDARYDLAVASAAEIDASTYYATPFNRNGQALELFLHGNLLTPQGFTGTVQVLQNTNKGATGSYSIVQDTWGSNLAGSFGADTAGYYYAVQNGAAGGAFTITSPSKLTDADESDTGIAKASDTTAVVIYGDANEVKAIAYDATDLSVGSAISLDTTAFATFGAFGCAYLEDGKVIVCWRRNSTVRAVIITVSGLTLTAGSQVEVQSSGINNRTKITEISATRAICTYTRSGVYGRVLDVSGTTITVQSEVTIDASADSVANMATIRDGDKAVILYKNSSNHWVANVLHTISTTFSVGATATVDSNNHVFDFSPPIVALDESSLATVYNISTTLYIRQLSESGNSLTVHTETSLSTRTVGTASNTNGLIANRTSGGWVGYGDSGSAGAFVIDVSFNGNNSSFGTDEQNWNATLERQHYNGDILTDNLASMITFTVADTDINGFTINAPGGNAKFHQGLGSLPEKFTLPFAAVQPAAMTLDQSLGRIVIASNAATTVPVVYADNPYPTGTATSLGYPTGTSTLAMKWI